MTVSLDGVDSELAERIRMLLVAVPGCYVRSAFRTFAQQQDLYRKYLAGGPLAAVPGTSLHEKGLAVDVDHHDWTALAKGAKQCGLILAVKGEPWHMQLHPKRTPIDSTVIPTITTIDHGEFDMATLRTINYQNVQLDSNGCGWVPVDAPVETILDITQQGSFPPADGYWNLCKFGKQQRVIPGSNTKSIIEIAQGTKKQVISFYVQVAA